MSRLINRLYLFIDFVLCTVLLFSCNTGTAPENPLDGTAYRQYGTPFVHIPKTKDIIMYEVNLRAFSPGGDLHGVIDRLDQIKALGVNVLWLMPIYPIGTIHSVNSPYSVKNYKEVNPEFGDLQTLRMLTDQAHNRNIAVILDWVANHTAWDNPWIENKNWYTQDSKGNIVHPAGTNWWDVADLNYDNAEMRAAMIDAMEYWVYKANIDGFRCDAADFVPYDFWKQALDALTSIPDRQLIYLAEGGRKDHFTAGFQMNYAWDYYGQLKNIFSGQSATSLYTTHLNEYQGLPAGKQKLRFTTNHDESAWDATPMVLFNGAAGSTAAFVLSTFMGGVPLIYGSQEVGTEANIPFFSNSTIDWNANPDMLKAYQTLLGFYSGSDAAKERTMENYSNSNVVCFEKTGTQDKVLVMVNVRGSGSNFVVPSQLQNTKWANVFSADSLTLAQNVPLDGYAYLILQK